jgi:hypothetical protein
MRYGQGKRRNRLNWSKIKQKTRNLLREAKIKANKKARQAVRRAGRIGRAGKSQISIKPVNPGRSFVK